MECKWYDVGCGLEWLRDEFHAFAIWLYDQILGALATLFEAIPVPGFFSQMTSFEIPSGVAFFASAFEIPFGLSVVVSAYIARFVLRRIPGIG